LIETSLTPIKSKGKGGPITIPIHIEVVLNYAASLEDIHRGIDAVMRDELTRRECRKKECGKTRPKKIRKQRKAYNSYLKVYDLRQKTYNAEVARKLYPTESGIDNSLRAEKKCIKQYTRASNLVKGGYRTIMF